VAVISKLEFQVFIAGPLRAGAGRFPARFGRGHLFELVIGVE